MVFCRFPDLRAKRMVEHYLFSQPVGKKAITEAIFKEFFVKKRLDWSKCKAVTTYGVVAMQDSQRGVIKRIQRLSPNCIGIRVLHRKALVTKNVN